MWYNKETNMQFGIGDFFADIKNFVSSGRVLGVDIGTVSIKAVELSRKRSGISLENYGMLTTKAYLERGNEAIQTSALKLVERDVAHLLSSLLREMRPKAKRVAASLPPFVAFAVPVELPMMTAQETARTVPFQARQFIPLPIEEVMLDWTKIDEFENERGGRFQRLLVTAIPQEVVERYKSIFKRAGLSLVTLETEGQSLVRILGRSDDPPTLVFDIGAASTSILIMERGTLKQLAQTDYGGLTLTQAVSRNLDVSAWRAEELKRRKGLIGSDRGIDYLSTALSPFLNVIIQEGMRARDAFERSFRKKVERVVLVGGGANLPGIGPFVAKETGIAIREPRPFARFAYPSALEPAMPLLNNEFALASGLAMRFYEQAL